MLWFLCHNHSHGFSVGRHTPRFCFYRIKSIFTDTLGKGGRVVSQSQPRPSLEGWLHGLGREDGVQHSDLLMFWMHQGYRFLFYSYFSFSLKYIF